MYVKVATIIYYLLNYLFLVEQRINRDKYRYVEVMSKLKLFIASRGGGGGWGGEG